MKKKMKWTMKLTSKMSMDQMMEAVMTGVRMTKRSTTIVMIVRKTNRIDQTHKLSHSRTNLKGMLV